MNAGRIGITRIRTLFDTCMKTYFLRYCWGIFAYDSSNFSKAFILSKSFSISTRCSNVKCFRLPLLFIFISNLHRQAISCKYSIHSNGHQWQYICAEVISMRLEFTLANWKLKIHLSWNISRLEWKSKFYILIYLDFMRDLILFSEIYNLIFLVYNAFYTA